MIDYTPISFVIFLIEITFKNDVYLALKPAPIIIQSRQILCQEIFKEIPVPVRPNAVASDLEIRQVRVK